MKYLGIDFGIKRVGLAVTSPDEVHVFPLRTVERTTRAAFFEEILKILKDEEIEGIVVGLPLRQDDSYSLTTSQATNFAQSLGRRTTLPIYMINEYLSSFEAEENLKSRNIPFAKRKALLDQMAAVGILESFLSIPTSQRRKI